MTGMSPYPEPYQNIYQQRRLGALGIEWRPSSIKFNTGHADNPHLALQDYQMFPLPDLDRWVEPLPEFVDTVDWEKENDAQSDDTDSEYNVPEEYATEGEQGSVSACSRSLDCSDENSEDDQSVKEGLRKSKRQKLKAKVSENTHTHTQKKKKTPCHMLFYDAWL